jgi:hypothetical protein
MGQRLADSSPNCLRSTGLGSENLVVYATTSPLSVVNILHDKNSLLPESENIYHALPFLSPSSLRSSCDRDVWTRKTLKSLRRDQMHVLGLYNTGLAVGSLTAGVVSLQAIRTKLNISKFQQTPSNPKKVVTDVQL